jgi:cytochrome c
MKFFHLHCKGKNNRKPLIFLEEISMLPALLSRIIVLVGCFSAALVSAETEAPAKKSYDIDSLISAADSKRGRMLFIQCQACHTLKEGEPNRVGPNLAGVYGRAAGQAKDFAYSDALKASGITWNSETLDAFLERPGDVIPGTKMVFVGVKKPEDRAAIINWVKQETGK